MTFEPVEIVPGDAASGLLIVCDHARSAVPPELGALGLDPEVFERHIAYDIGARVATLRLAERLGAPAVLSCFSRLVIDPNRGRDDPTLVMRLSDGAIVPGNARIDAKEIGRRIDVYHEPYHKAVERAIDAAVSAGMQPALVSIHSFTPVWKDFVRPWHVGVLWDRDPRLAVPLIAGLREDRSLVVGDNEPYSGQLRGDTMYRHGTSRGLPHALVEFRQDLVASDAGACAWADRVADILRGIKEAGDLNTVRYFGSETG